MSAISHAVRGIRSMWSHGDEDDYSSDELDSSEPTPASTAQPQSYNPGSYRPATPPGYAPSYGGSGGNGSASSRKLRSVADPLRRRDKNIYTLKPKSQDEASIAADYLKTGSAVVLNLDDVDRTMATRIIDFMSGVCYGLEHQGHAMKLGDTIFLFTPGEFEISSDETDYGENREFFFKDAPALNGQVLNAQATSPRADAPVADERDRRLWEQ